MILKNARVYNGRKFACADIITRDGKFAAVNYSDSAAPCTQPEVIIPGFVDIHSHGAAGVDMMSSDSAELVEMSGFYARHGVTTLLPSTVSDSREKIMRMISEVKKARKLALTDFAGIHLEGPYINRNKAGAHTPEAVRDINLCELEEICAAVLDCGLKLHVTLAPEIDGGLDAVKFLKKRGATVALGHTEANAEIIKQALKAGAVSFTHLFNAMSGIHHRDAGVAGRAINSGIYAELICDGIHVCPEVVSMTARAKGLEKIIIVSDSMCAAGLPDGEYNLGRSAVSVSGGRVVLKGTDTIAGSAADMCGGLLNFIKFTGAGFEDALPLVTRNPAECVGLYGSKGEIAEGKDADFIVWDSGIKQVYARGERVF